MEMRQSRTLSNPPGQAIVRLTGLDGVHEP
jgi:hypothetical protein